MNENEMKKVLFILVIGFLCITAVKESLAQCTPPATEKWVNFPLCPGCSNLSARLCINCSPTSGEMGVTILEIKGCSSSDLLFYIDYIQAWVGPNYSSLCTGIWIPCSQGTNELEVCLPLCFIEYDDLGEYQGHFLFCNSSYCVHTYEVCTDQNGDHSVYIDSRVEGSLNCSNVVYPEQEYEECFRTDYCQ